MSVPSAVPASVTHDADLRASVARDASGLELVPDALARPGSVGEVRELLAWAARDRIPVTAAGGQSSTTGASVADRGLLLSLRGLDRVLDVDHAGRTVRVEAGAMLGPLKRQLAADGLLLAPDPTSEDDCTVGGAIACNASGARSLRFGATRAHVRGLTVLTIGGETLDIRRPQLEKNTVGYAPLFDLVDWFTGSEGTLGVIVAAELALLPLPAHVTGLAFPFATEGDALAFVAAARERGSPAPRCLEFMDANALGIARTAASDPAWASGAAALVYAELDGDEPPELDGWLALAEEHAAIVDDVRAYEGEAALRDARRLRHAIPATMNERGARRRPYGGRKVSTDWAVPYRRLGEALAHARAEVAARGLEQPVTYGHAGNGHPHQNFIAQDAEELARITDAVGATLHHVLRLGGTVAAEHGIGKLKARWLPLQASGTQLALMRAVKRELDPHNLLAPGNIL